MMLQLGHTSNGIFVLSKFWVIFYYAIVRADVMSKSSPLKNMQVCYATFVMYFQNVSLCQKVFPVHLNKYMLYRGLIERSRTNGMHWAKIIM